MKKYFGPLIGQCVFTVVAATSHVPVRYAETGKTPAA